MLRNSHFILLLVISAILPGCTNNTTDPKPKEMVTEPKLSTQDYQRAFELKNRGIGHLENKEWAAAEKTLSALATLLPESRLARRNLAISRVLSLTDRASTFTRSGPPENEQTYRKAVGAAKQAIESYRALATDSYDTAIADLLMGNLLAHDDSPESPSIEEALKLLRAAADSQPTAADFRFALAMAMDGHREFSDVDSTRSAELLTALQASFQLAPQNLFALQKLLQRQALCLNSKNDETRKLALQITDTFKVATQLLAPLNESIKKQRRMDLVETLTKALEGFDGTNTSALMGPAMMTGNLLLPELATQIDQRRLHKNILEYLLLEFGEEFPTRIEPAIEEATRTVIVGFTKGSRLPELQGVTKIQMLDFDLNGRDDLVVVRDGKFEVYTRDATAKTKWKLMLSAPDDVGPVTGYVLADIDRDYDKAISELQSPLLLLDRDGDRKIVEDPVGKNRWFDTDHDVVLWGENGVTVLRNEVQEDGHRSLTIMPQDDTVSRINEVIAVDLESDGDLDLVFATETGLTLWQNTDGTTFLNVNDSAHLPSASITALAACDWDRNIAMDVIGVAADGQAGFLQNILHNRYRWVETETGLENLAAASEMTVDELDGSGSWDVVTAGPSGITIVTTTGGANTSVKTKSTVSLSADPALGARTADLDNDGISDVIAWGVNGVQFYRGTGDGQFEDLSSLLPGLKNVVGLTTNDIDEDGDLDVVFTAAAETSSGVPAVLINDGGNNNHWISVVARGKPDDDQFKSNRVNAHATGAVIEVRCGTRYQAHLIADAKIHIGLGECSRPDNIRIIWTDGVPQNVMTENLLRPGIGILAPQILKGSCPYIYTWTGEQFEFFSDCLWAAPLGLVQASGEVAPTREWENLRIPGSALVENEGRYRLQLTEELWETAYLDHVQLTAIDHPSDVDIFTNEKVGSPAMAEHKIHTVRNPQLPVSVVDGRGNDLLPGLKSRDGDYVQAFERRIMQGLTDEWAMEFDLGESTTIDAATTNKARIRLFLIGWVFPTDTSLNLGIEQNSSLQPPAPPSIEVPDGSGGWKVVRPFIGFPSGKTKAMVVDVSDVLDGANRRFRIKSSMELYWDQAFFTEAEDDAQTVAQSCSLLGSDLHFRGFSRRVYADNALFRNGRAPESYDYQSITTEPRWPPLFGRFTRYGDALPLLLSHDDQMVVMGPGDELTLEFQVPSKPVPQGWTRDFVLTNVGYDKDADLNTIYGQSSEPFPFRAMTRYPFAANDQIPDSAEHQQYLNEWQTREYSPKPFWDAVRDDKGSGRN